MTKRTTADWEALLDGWATVAQGANLVEAKAALKRMEEQKRAAPEAAAEVVRLRRELEELRDNLADPWQAQTGYEHGLQAGYDYAAYTLTRILEGTHDERHDSE